MMWSHCNVVSLVVCVFSLVVCVFSLVVCVLYAVLDCPDTTVGSNWGSGCTCSTAGSIQASDSSPFYSGSCFPASFSDDDAVTTGGAETVTITGVGLDLTASGGDSAKVVTSSGSCSDSAAGGTSEVTDLGPGNSDRATKATAAFTFAVAGGYKVCYKVAGGSYAQVGSSLLTVAAVVPTGFNGDAAIEIQGTETISFTGGSGLKTWDDQVGGDAAKVVTSTSTCSDSAGGGTSEVTDLGPDDADNSTQANATFTFTTGGDYKVCYKVHAGSYTQVGSSLLWVGPTGYSDDGAVTTGGTETINIVGGTGFNLSNGNGDSAKMVSDSGNCSDAAGGGTSEMTDLGPDDANGAAAATATFNFTVAGKYKLCYKVSGGTYIQVGSSLLTAAAVVPTGFNGDAAIEIQGTETISFTGGSGLKTWDDQVGGDAAKVVTSTSTCSDSAGGGTSEVTDLGPDDADNSTQANATFTFTTGGDYKVCYKVHAGSYTQVGSSLLWVGPTGYSDDGAVTTGGTETINIVGGTGFNLSNGNGDSAKMVSDSGNCSDAAGGGTSEMTDLGPDDANGAAAATATFNFTVAGKYKLCYKVSGGTYIQVGSSLLTVIGTAPTGYSDDEVVSTGGSETIIFLGGTGLNLRDGGDTAKVVKDADTCAYPAAGGTSEVTNLGPDDSEGAFNATTAFTPTVAGMYKICYKVEGGTYTEVGTQWTVKGVVPTSFQDDGAVLISQGSPVTEYIDVYGGSGMKLASGKDSLKAVDWHEKCADGTPTAGGSTEVTDLGNDDADDATAATAALHFNGSGSYKICYKLFGSNYTQVGTALLMVTTNSTPDSAYRQISQNVSFTALPNCHFWTGQTQTVLTLAYASAIGIYVGTDRFDPYVFDHFLHTDCYDWAGKPVISFEVTVHQSKIQVVTQQMSALRPPRIAQDVAFINGSSQAYTISPIPDNAIVVSPPGTAHSATHSVPPMVWMDDGSLTIGSNESFTLLIGFGLRLGPGQDAMKA